MEDCSPTSDAITDTIEVTVETLGRDGRVLWDEVIWRGDVE
jgi:hypothetical protein